MYRSKNDKLPCGRKNVLGADRRCSCSVAERECKLAKSREEFSPFVCDRNCKCLAQSDYNRETLIITLFAL